MNETDAIRRHLYRYGAILSRQIDRLYNCFGRTAAHHACSCLEPPMNTPRNRLIDAVAATRSNSRIDADGFYQSLRLCLPPFAKAWPHPHRSA